MFGKKNTKEESFDDFDMEEEKKFQPASSSKVTPMRHPASRKGGNMEVCVVKPSSVDDSREITETLLSGRTVILNLEGMDLELAQRIIDFISGATFAIKISIFWKSVLLNYPEMHIKEILSHTLIF